MKYNLNLKIKDITEIGIKKIIEVGYDKDNVLDSCYKEYKNKRKNIKNYLENNKNERKKIKKYLVNKKLNTKIKLFEYQKSDFNNYWKLKFEYIKQEKIKLDKAIHKIKLLNKLPI